MVYLDGIGETMATSEVDSHRFHAFRSRTKTRGRLVRKRLIRH